MIKLTREEVDRAVEVRNSLTHAEVADACRAAGVDTWVAAEPVAWRLAWDRVIDEESAGRATLKVREAARLRVPIGPADAQALEGALAMTERERDEARAKLDSLKHQETVYNAIFDREPRIHELFVKGGEMRALVDGGAIVKIVAEAFWQTIVEGGGKNYLELTLDRPDAPDKAIVVLLQKRTGNTPGNIATEAKARAEAAEAEAASLRAQLAEVTRERDEARQCAAVADQLACPEGHLR